MLLSSLMVAAALQAASVDVLPSWRGEALSAWTKGACQCADVRVENGLLKGRVTGRDGQLYANVPEPFRPRPNQYVIVRVRLACSGRGQVFWIRTCDEKASARRQCTLPFVSGGDWQTCRVRPGWSGKDRIRRLRLDFPTVAAGVPFEIESVAVVAEGPDTPVSVDTRTMNGVVFDLTMPPGQHYCSLVWNTDAEVPGAYGFTPATDGRRHTYWFDLRDARVRSWGPLRGKPNWCGTIDAFTVEQRLQGRLLPAENITFVAERPDTPADVTILHAGPNEAIPRAGRDFSVEVVVRNLGTRASGAIELAFDGLPPGVRLRDADACRLASLPGWDGRSTICADVRPQLTCEHVFRPRMTDLGVGVHSLGVTLKVAGSVIQRVPFEVEVKPSLGLAPQAYPAEPQPVDTAPYEIGAFLFPGWVSHGWHAVWAHAPWRKPVLGWYDETKPETIDWQIKHLVENGVSYVLVDWYWRRQKLGTHHWMESFAKARYRTYLKWSVMWANHNDKGSHSVADQEAVTRYWIDHYFADPQYQRLDGMPVVTIWSAENMEKDLAGKGGCRGLLEISQRLAREAGYRGIYFIAVRHSDSEDAGYLKTFAEQGFRRTCVYKYLGGIPGCPEKIDGSRPYSFLASSSLAHWRTLRQNSTLPFLPSLSTAWDNRPWLGEEGWEITGVAPDGLRRICADARRYSDESGERMLLLGPMDEWGEGSIGYPNREHGFGMLEAVRDVFGHKPAAGWPLNYAPQDVRLVCPARAD